MGKVNVEITRKEYYKEIHFLYEIIGSLKSIEELKAFIKDVLTRSELIMLKRRWHIATLLYSGLDIRAVAKLSHTSTQTVSRIKQVLEAGTGGLRIALGRAKEQENKQKEAYRNLKLPHGGSNFVKGWFR